MSFRNIGWVDLSSRVGRVKVKQVALRDGVWGLLPSSDRLLFNMAIRWLDRVRKPLVLEVLGRIVDKLRSLWLTLRSRFIQFCLRSAGRILERRVEAFKPFMRGVHPQFRDAYLNRLRDIACHVDEAVYVAVQASNENACFRR
jgi:hypothetical protein